MRIVYLHKWIYIFITNFRINSLLHYNIYFDKIRVLIITVSFQIEVTVGNGGFFFLKRGISTGIVGGNIIEDYLFLGNFVENDKTKAEVDINPSFVLNCYFYSIVRTSALSTARSSSPFFAYTATRYLPSGNTVPSTSVPFQSW